MTRSVRLQFSTRHLVLAGAAVAGVWLAIKLWSVLLLAGIALILAAALMPYVEWLRPRVRSRSLAVLIAVLTVLVGCGALTLVVAQPLVTQGQDLWDRAPELQQRGAHFAHERGWYDLEQRITDFAPEDLVGRRLVDVGLTALSVSLTAFTTIVLAAYFLLDARRIERFVHFSTPRDWRRHIAALFPALQRVVGGYVRGQAITSALIAVFAFVMLSLLHVPNALALAGLAAICDVIPMIGALMMIVPMALVALTVSPTVAVVVVALNLVYQQFEDRVLVPRVYGATMRLPAVAVVLALLAGNELLGLTGAIIALPVAAAIRVVVEYFAEVRAAAPQRAARLGAPTGQPCAPDRSAPSPLRSPSRTRAPRPSLRAPRVARRPARSPATPRTPIARRRRPA